MFFYFLFVFLLFYVNISDAQLIISEIYRDPPGKENELCGGASHEFIELLNMGLTSIRVDNLFITNGIGSDSIIPFSKIIDRHKGCIYNAKEIPPGKIALILDPDYLEAVNNFLCSFDLPDSVVLLQCNDRAFGVSGLAVDHGVVVYRGTKNIIDTILCSTGKEYFHLQSPTETKIKLSDPPDREGISLIRQYALSDTISFKYCNKNISPGIFENLKNGWIVEYTTKKDEIAAVNCTIKIKNINPQKKSDILWGIISKNGFYEKKIFEGTLILENNYGEISLNLLAELAPFKFVLFTEDRPEWDIDISKYFLSSDALKITEIFPKSNNIEPEWFEILNNSNIPINLKNWTYGKLDERVKITNMDFVLEPGTYVVITKDRKKFFSRYPSTYNVIMPELWITLNNSSDTICLFDDEGTIREMVCYDSKWFSNMSHQSIERNSNIEGCDSNSWSVAFRPTPQMPNKALYWRDTTGFSLDIGPIPFTPDNDGKDDLLAIRVKAPSPFSISLLILGFDGRVLKEFPEVKEEITYWNGITYKGKAPSGPFFVIATINSKNRERIRKKGVLWRK